MRKLLLVFFWLIPYILFAQSPEGVIRGRVYDISSGTGLSGANIILKRNVGTVAGADGRFLLKTGPGSFNLIVQHIGFKPITRNITVTLNDTLMLDLGMEQEISEIDQVVVSASRIEQKISELSVSMSLIRPDQVARGHIGDAQELINKAPGIEVLDGQASIRGGSGFSYGAGSRVLALIDGLPVMSPDAGNVRWQFLPLDQISQVEIIKGASSVVYGSSALNGIINFRTADASVQPVTRAYVESGIYDNPPNPEWKWWSKPRSFSSASVSHLQRSGQTDIGLGAFLVTDAGYRRLNDEHLARGHLKLKHRSRSVEGLFYGVSVNGGITRKTDFILWENAQSGALKHSESTAIELHSNFLTVDPFVTLWRAERYRHELKARLQHSSNRFPDAEQNNSNPVNLYAEYQFWNRVSDFFTFIAGITENYSRINSRFYGDHTFFNLGSFAQLDIQPAERLRGVAGVRLEHNTLDGVSDKLVPLFRAGLNYQAKDYTFVRASYGQGYRYPSIAEKHAATTLGSVKIYPSPNIEAEKGWNSELGIKQGISTRYFQGQVDLALFYSQNSGMIEYIFGNYPDPADGNYGFGFRAFNTEASRVYGAELEYVINKTIGNVTNILSGGYVFMYPVEYNPNTGKNTGVMLKYRRKQAASLNLVSTYRKLDMGVSLYYKSRMLNIDDVFLNELTRETILPGFFDYWQEHNKGYFLADVQTGYSFRENYQVSLVVKNVTNTEYMGRPGDIQPHRNFSLRLSGSF